RLEAHRIAAQRHVTVEPPKHVLLGAGGVIANELATELRRERQDVRLVSRSGAAIEGSESLRCDLLDPVSVREAIPQGSVVYLIVGLRYDIRVWRVEWPRIMANVLDACTERQARLIFFDNVYMYGRVAGVMTEDTAIRPASEKGVVRAQIAASVLEAAKSGRLQACIARAADFYGPNASNSFVNRVVLPPLSKGKPAQWLVNADMPHSLTYTRDCGRALPLLARAPDVSGGVWHLTTAEPPLTCREVV